MWRKSKDSGNDVSSFSGSKTCIVTMKRKYLATVHLRDGYIYPAAGLLTLEYTCQQTISQ